MAKKSKPSVDMAALQQKLQAQFSGLNPNDPSTWPVLPRALLMLVVAVAVVAGLWYAVLSSYEEQLVKEQQTEVKLRDEYKKKVAQAVNLDLLKAQLEQVRQYVTQLEKQLPGKAEMDALLSDINQAGVGRGLAFQLFRPGGVSVKEYYAELPINVTVTGSYNDVALFASDIAHLSRIVTLNNLTLTPRGSDLTMTCIAKTFRYLDPEELAQQNKAKAGKKKGKK